MGTKPNLSPSPISVFISNSLFCFRLFIFPFYVLVSRSPLPVPGPRSPVPGPRSPVPVPRSPFPVLVTSLFSSLPLIFTLLVAGISHFLTAAILFLQRNMSLCFFSLSRFSSFSVINVSVDI